MQTIRRVTASEIVGQSDWFELFADHYNEVEIGSEEMKCNIDVERYVQIEAMGALRIFGAYADDMLIGYSINILAPYQASMDHLVMTNDGLFVAKSWRNSPACLRLMKATEDEASDVGATLMMWGARPSSALARILERRRYNHETNFYSREV